VRSVHQKGRAMEDKPRPTIEELKSKIIREVGWYYATFRKPLRHAHLNSQVQGVFRRCPAQDLFEVCLDLRSEGLLVVLANQKNQKFYLPANHAEIKKITGDSKNNVDEGYKEI